MPTSFIELDFAGSGRTHTRTERLLDGRLSIRTPKGLAPMDRLFTAAVAAAPGTRALAVELPNPMAPLALRAVRPEVYVAFHHLDLSRVRQATGLAEQNAIEGLDLHCLSDLPRLDPPPDLILMQLRRDGEGGLTCELIRQAHDRLTSGGHLIVAINNTRDQWLRRLLEKTFGNLTQLDKNKHGIVYSVKRKGPPTPLPADPSQPEYYIKQIEVRLGDLSLPFETAYGTFSSEKLDDSSRALLEVMKPPSPCDAILDLGCGWGALGILAARTTGASRLVMIDANARAVDLARRNAERLELAGATVYLETDPQAVLTDAESAPFDMVLSNPPPINENRVAETFLRAARSALRPGGCLWLVAKNNSHLAERAEEVFDSVETFGRRGYDVIAASRQA